MAVVKKQTVPPAGHVGGKIFTGDFVTFQKYSLPQREVSVPRDVSSCQKLALGEVCQPPSPPSLLDGETPPPTIRT